MKQPLCQLSPGQTAVVHSLCATDGMRRRLQDFGLIEGTPVECAFHSPLGDPTAYLIRGTLVALRQSDAVMVWVTPTPESR